MSQKTKTALKQYFVSKAIPTSSQFGDLIDSLQSTLIANGMLRYIPGVMGQLKLMLIYLNRNL